MKNGSELALEKEPHWWKYLNPDFLEESKVINWTSSSGETSFVRNEDDDDEEHISNDGDKEKKRWYRPRQHSELHATNLDTGESWDKKIVVVLHKKRQQVRSTKWALGQVANSLQITAETSLKHFKRMPEEDQRREKRYTELQWEEARKNWEHELCIA